MTDATPKPPLWALDLELIRADVNRSAVGLVPMPVVIAHILALIDEAAEARAELAALREDRERLDWIAVQREVSVSATDDGDGKVYFWIELEHRSVDHDDLRACIDAARRSP